MSQGFFICLSIFDWDGHRRSLGLLHDSVYSLWWRFGYRLQTKIKPKGLAAFSPGLAQPWVSRHQTCPLRSTPKGLRPDAESPLTSHLGQNLFEVHPSSVPAVLLSQGSANPGSPGIIRTLCDQPQRGCGLMPNRPSHPTLDRTSLRFALHLFPPSPYPRVLRTLGSNTQAPWA